MESCDVIARTDSDEAIACYDGIASPAARNDITNPASYLWKLIIQNGVWSALWVEQNTHTEKK